MLSRDVSKFAKSAAKQLDKHDKSNDKAAKAKRDQALFNIDCQEVEISAIESIFGDIVSRVKDYDDAFVNAFTISLRPAAAAANDTRLSAKILIQLPDMYPSDDVAHIAVVSSSGLPVADVGALMRSMQSFCKKGEEHIYAVIAACQDFLACKYEEMPEQASLYERMQSEKQRAAAESAQQKQRQLDDDKKAAEAASKRADEQAALARLDLKAEEKMREKWLEQQPQSQKDLHHTATNVVNANVTAANYSDYNQTSNITPVADTLLLSSKSRYQNDFIQLRQLGKGSFGTVMLVQNKIDGRYYAIKRIEIRGNDQHLQRILREVTSLSRLQHENVLRYFGCWIEGGEAVDANQADAHGPIIEHSNDWLDSTNDFSLRSDSLYNNNQRDSSASMTQSMVPSMSARRHGLSLSLNADSETKHTYYSESSHSAQRQPLYLYIQTQACEQTLRETLNQTNDAVVLWKRFRQIAEGLAHIHAHGIIHRDLKPGNIFIETHSDLIKIGDFGLATAVNSESALAEHEVASQSADPDLTSGVGTHWYMSPEQREEGGRYDVKTDVYSLGIIFFELWCPFSSSQDRHAALQRLRTHGTFPAHFPESHPRQVKIIRWLLDDQPSRRPTVPELLASELLPPKIEDESLRDALRIFSNPSSAFYSRMLDALFNTALQFSSAASFANAIESQRSVLNPLADPMQQSTLSWAVSPQLLQSALVSHTSRANTTDGDNIMNHELLASRCVDIVTATLKSVFAKHSASVLNTPTLTPPLSAVASSSDAGSSSTNASASKPNTDGVMLLDRSGAPVAMRTDLRVGFVRHCACRPWLTIRRYELGTVFRSTGSVEMMKEVLQSDFDMVHFDAVPAVSVASVADKPSTLRSRGSSNALAELPKLSQQAAARACYDAELIVVASEVLQALSPLLSSTSAASAIRLRIGHSNLLSAVLSACSVPPQHLSLVHNVLASQITMASHLNQQQQIAQHWTSIRAALSQTLTSNSLDRMSDFFMVRFTHGGIQHAVTVLKDMLHCEAMMELVLIAELVELMGATIQLQLDPLLCLPAKIAGQYSGLVIKGESAMETLLVGGRYTAYLNDAIKQVTAHGSMVAKDQTYNRGAVGMSFAVEKLSAAILRQQSNSLLSLSTFAVPSASALVFVASVGADAWTERLRIVGELWRENVRASFITDDSISLAEQIDAASVAGASVLIVYNSKLPNIVRVRSHANGGVNEQEVSRKEIAKFCAPTKRR